MCGWPNKLNASLIRIFRFTISYGGSEGRKRHEKISFSLKLSQWKIYWTSEINKLLNCCGRTDSQLAKILIIKVKHDESIMRKKNIFTGAIYEIIRELILMRWMMVILTKGEQQSGMLMDFLKAQTFC